MLKVEYGSVYNENKSFLIDNMCIIVDKEMGSIMKYGDAETSDIKQYYTTMCSRYNELGFSDMAESLVFIEFDRYKEQLTIEEICTIVNYGMNCHNKIFMDLFDMEISVLHKRISELKEFGY